MLWKIVSTFLAQWCLNPRFQNVQSDHQKLRMTLHYNDCTALTEEMLALGDWRETERMICYVVLNGHSFTLSRGSRLGTRLTHKLTQIHMWLNWLKLRHRFLCEHPDNHINSATTNLQAHDSKFNHVDAHIKIVFMTLTSSGSCFGFCLVLLICKRGKKVVNRQRTQHIIYQKLLLYAST